MAVTEKFVLDLEEKCVLSEEEDDETEAMTPVNGTMTPVHETTTPTNTLTNDTMKRKFRRQKRQRRRRRRKQKKMVVRLLVGETTTRKVIFKDSIGWWDNMEVNRFMWIISNLRTVYYMTHGIAAPIWTGSDRGLYVTETLGFKC